MSDRRYDPARRCQREQQLLATGTPLPARITAALDARDLYGPEVDRACGVEEPTVDLWEAGELVPTAEQVQALARLTGYPVSFFYHPLIAVGPVWVCRRGRGGGCERVDRDPVPEEGGEQAGAEVVLLPGTDGRLF